FFSSRRRHTRSTRDWSSDVCSSDLAPRDLVLLSGPEPAMHWRGFSRVVVDLAEALGVQLVVLLGALLADVPHSRPVSVTAHASEIGRASCRGRVEFSVVGAVLCDYC